MGKTHNPIFPTPLHDKKDEPKSEISSATQDAYSSGLNALRNELTALRADEPFLNKLERKSISALIAYSAYSNGTNEEVVLTLVENRFGASDISKIYSRDFDDVIHYLIDLNPQKAIN